MMRKDFWKNPVISMGSLVRLLHQFFFFSGIVNVVDKCSTNSSGLIYGSGGYR